MIPDRIVRHLEERQIPFTRRPHARAITAQELAYSTHVSGHRVAKSVVLDVDGVLWLAVVPAPALVDVDLVAAALNARHVRLAREEEFERCFPDCEVGAEPPFGRLFGLPVLADESLAEEERLVFNAGSHEEALELAFTDYRAIEQPRFARIGRIPAWPPMTESPEARA